MPFEDGKQLLVQMEQLQADKQQATIKFILEKVRIFYK